MFNRRSTHIKQNESEMNKQIDIKLFIFFGWYYSLNRVFIYINVGFVFSTAGPTGEYPKIRRALLDTSATCCATSAVLVEFFLLRL